MNNFRLPSTKKEKADFIKAMIKGEKTIEDLRPATAVGYDVVLNLTPGIALPLLTPKQELKRLHDLRTRKLIEVTIDLSK